MSEIRLSLKVAVGLGSSRRVIAGSAIIAMISFFYIFSAGSFFQINSYPLENRVTHNLTFESYVNSKSWDYFIIISGMTAWLTEFERDAAICSSCGARCDCRTEWIHTTLLFHSRYSHTHLRPCSHIAFSLRQVAREN